jgi:hypothetical protein
MGIAPAARPLARIAAGVTICDQPGALHHGPLRWPSPLNRIKPPPPKATTEAELREERGRQMAQAGYWGPHVVSIAN